MSWSTPVRDLAAGAYTALPTTDDEVSKDRRSILIDEDPITIIGHLHSAESMWRFVESGWFQAISVVIIIINLIIMILETTDVELRARMYIADQAILCFYIFEVVARIGFFGRHFFIGPPQRVTWNILDVLVVSGGIVDEWLAQFLNVQEGSPSQVCLQAVKFLRVARVMKIMRIFLESDLSWAESAKFQSFIGFVIAFNSVLMGMETDIDWQGWFLIEQVLLTIYVFELAVRLKRFGLNFLSCHNPDIVWNALDTVIVMSSSIDSWVLPLITLAEKALKEGSTSSERSGESSGMSFGQAMMLIRMLRLMRILRLVKLVKSVMPLYILVTSILAACQGVAWVLVLTLVVLYAMGIMSTRLIGHGLLFSASNSVPSSVTIPFATVPDSMFTLFRVMSGAASDDEAAAIDELIAELPTIKFAFIFFMISSSWTLLSILTAVVSENMISTTGAQEYEMKLASDEEDREKHMQELQVLFKSIDRSGDGLVNEAELLTFLKVKENALQCAKVCRVPVRYIKDVFRYLSVDGQEVDMHHFTECLVDVGQPVTEKSVMRLEARLTQLQRKTDKFTKRVSRSMGIHELPSFVEELYCDSHQLHEDHDHHEETMHEDDKEACLKPTNETLQEIAEMVKQISEVVERWNTSLETFFQKYGGEGGFTSVNKAPVERPEATRVDPKRNALQTAGSDLEPYFQSLEQQVTATWMTCASSCTQSEPCNQYDAVLGALKARIDNLIDTVAQELTIKALISDGGTERACPDMPKQGIEPIQWSCDSSSTHSNSSGPHNHKLPMSSPLQELGLSYATGSVTRTQSLPSRVSPSTGKGVSSHSAR